MLRRGGATGESALSGWASDAAAGSLAAMRGVGRAVGRWARQVAMWAVVVAGQAEEWRRGAGRGRRGPVARLVRRHKEWARWWMMSRYGWVWEVVSEVLRNESAHYARQDAGMTQGARVAGTGRVEQERAQLQKGGGGNTRTMNVSNNNETYRKKQTKRHGVSFM